MESMDELRQFLRPGTRADVQLQALNYLRNLSGKNEILEILEKNPEILADLKNLFVAQNETGISGIQSEGIPGMNENQAEKNQTEEILGILLDIFINFSTHEIFIEKFLEKNLIEKIFDQILKKNSKKSQKISGKSAKFLSNLIRVEKNAEIFLNLFEESKFFEKLNELLNLFTKNSATEFDSIGFPLVNFTQLKEVRQWLLDSGHLANILVLFTHPSVLRRQSAVDIFRNSSFDTENHSKITEIPDFLVNILLPLAGPETLDDEENDKLPVDLQYLEPTKEREPVAAIRIKLLESFYQMCATKTGREKLRNNGAYYILREYHKWEKTPEADLICGNVIGILIRYEDEIGFENLKELNE